MSKHGGFDPRPDQAPTREEDDMSEKTEKASAAVIRRMEAAEESAQERLVKKHVPAWVVSGAVHVAVIALLILVLGVKDAATKQPDKIVNTTAAKTDEPEDVDLTNDDLGIDSNIEAALPEIERIDQKTVEAAVTEDTIGKPDVTDTAMNAVALPGVSSTEFTAPGAAGDTGNVMSGLGGGEGGTAFGTMAGRSGATKSRLLKEGGGNKDSELAVAYGLAWLAKQQKADDGGWKFDQGKTEERTCATGMALLPFLAAGVTHKKPRDKTDNKNYHEVVHKGIEFLKRAMGPPSGGGATVGKLSGDVYANAIAALPLCEAYGMTQDPALRPYAQAAVNYIARTQGPNGSWGYGNKGDGDTSIVGWQLQVLKAAKLAKGLVVDDRVIKKADKFLDLVASGSRKSMYGYRDSAGAKPGTALTAVGLLSRYYISEWGPVHPGMIDGVGGLMKNAPAGTGNVNNMYYYYYATQVVHFFEGEDWKTWNEGPKQADGTRKGGMRDWLVKSQKRNATELGSWDPEAGWFGTSCGRLGTTAMCLLTLEVYYRHLPLYKRGADGAAVKIIE